MHVFRIEKARYETLPQILSGEGARRHGGRWNPPGTALVYTSATPELAAWEVWVHLAGLVETELPPLVLVTLDIPDETILRVDEKQFPVNWNEVPPPESTKTFTKNWLRKKKYLALRVPSVVISGAYNYLLNPAHSRIEEVRMVEMQSFVFDARLIVSRREATTVAADLLDRLLLKKN